MTVVPAGEREEVRQLLARDGLEGDVLDEATATVTTDRERWIELMMAREHGIDTATPSAWRASARTDVEVQGRGASSIDEATEAS